MQHAVALYDTRTLRAVEAAARVFKTLKAAGFDGPIMVECCKVGATAEATMANARANRVFLERLMAQV